MFIVVSKWMPKPDKLAEWNQAAAGIPASFSAMPGVELFQRFTNEDGLVVAIMGYRDKATYEALVSDPNGAVAKDMAARNLEAYGTWISSERGETFE